MTTSRSPLSALKRQADVIAKGLKQMERGELASIIAHDPSGKITAARARDRVKFGVVMDDKVFTIEMPWSTIRETSEAGISAWIVKHMRGERDAAH